MERGTHGVRDAAREGRAMRMHAGRVVEILEQHTRSDGVLMYLVGWRDVYTGQMTMWVRADEVTS